MELSDKNVIIPKSKSPEAFEASGYIRGLLLSPSYSSVSPAATFAALAATSLSCTSDGHCS